MSINLYGRLETYDPDIALFNWESSPILYNNSAGIPQEVDLIAGGRSTIDILFGRSHFEGSDRVYFEEHEDDLTEEENNKNTVLKKIEDIIDRALYPCGFPDNASPQTKDVIRKWSAGLFTDREYLPDTAVYTLDDLETLEALCAAYSTHANNIFNLHYRHVFNILNIMAICYNKSIHPNWKQCFRVVLYAV